LWQRYEIFSLYLTKIKIDFDNAILARHKNSEGPYFEVLPFADLWVSGRKYRIDFPIKTNFKCGFTTLGTKNSEGLYLRYRPLLVYGLAAGNTA
jgi:hypothetical protein